MPDTRLTNEKMKTFTSDEKISMFQTAEKLAELGEKQNAANEALAWNVNDLIKRVCALEDRQIINTDKISSLENKNSAHMDAICILEDKQTENMRVMQKIADDLKEFKRELDRVRLTEKLNSGAIERLDRALRLAEEQTE